MRRVGLVVLYLLLCLVLVIPLGTLATAEDASWSISVDVTCNINSVSATFGMNPAASAGFGYDNGLDQVGPPAPPEGQEAYFWHSTNTPDYAKKLSTSLVAPAAEVVWPFRVNYVKMGPATSDVTVSWDPADIPSGYTIVLMDVVTTTVTDMALTSSYTFQISYDDTSSSQMRSLKVTSTLKAPATKPPAVASSLATATATTSTTLNGNLTSLGTASAVQVSFEYGQGTSYGSTTPDQIMAANSTFNASISGLTPETTYHFRAKAVGDGTAHGDDMTFTTAAPTPEIEGVDPGRGKRKQHLTVIIAGTNFDGAMIVSFGSGIAVDDFDVSSSTEITAEITIDADAAKGARDVTVTTALGTATETDGFTVAGGGGGICSGGAMATPNDPSEMMTVLAALGLLAGAGYFLVKKVTRRELRHVHTAPHADSN